MTGVGTGIFPSGIYQSKNRPTPNSEAILYPKELTIYGYEFVVNGEGRFKMSI